MHKRQSRFSRTPCFVVQYPPVRGDYGLSRRRLAAQGIATPMSSSVRLTCGRVCTIKKNPASIKKPGFFLCSPMDESLSSHRTIGRSEGKACSSVRLFVGSQLLDRFLNAAGARLRLLRFLDRVDVLFNHPPESHSHLPASCNIYASGNSPRHETKAMAVPSGDQRGVMS
jgi:hypothetical protein